MRHGTYILDEVDSAPESVLRGFIVKMVNLLLTQQRDFRDSLSKHGGVRAKPDEILQLAQKQQILSYFGVTEAFHLTLRTLVTPAE